MSLRLGRATAVGLTLVVASGVIYWLSDRLYDAGRGDLFYLADAFLHGRTWLQVPLGPWDVIPIDGRYYVPFAPFPAVALMPLVAVVGAVRADQLEPAVNAALGAACVGMGWWFLGRANVDRLVDRFWLALLLGFSTMILWVTVRGGVWHTGQLIATILTFGCLIELWGRRRAWLVGLLAGFAFLTRAPLAFAIPFYALLLVPETGWTDLRANLAGLARSIPWRAWVLLVLGVLPSLVAFFAYNQVRFGTPLESGYALATLPDWLAAQRDKGLFSLAHLGMNLDYFLVHLPRLRADFPYLVPDGLGMSVFITSPGLLYAVRADWRRPAAWWLAAAALAVLVPTLLYYGGGWLQYGYRYFLDSVPFVIALCGLAAAHRGRMGWGWRGLILVGTVVMAISVYWVYNL